MLTATDWVDRNRARVLDLVCAHHETLIPTYAAERDRINDLRRVPRSIFNREGCWLVAGVPQIEDVIPTHDGLMVEAVILSENPDDNEAYTQMFMVDEDALMEHVSEDDLVAEQ